MTFNVLYTIYDSIAVIIYNTGPYKQQLPSLMLVLSARKLTIDAGSWPLKCCSGYLKSSDGVITFLFLLGPPGNLKKYKKKENYYASV